jgi:hypothetical protein
MGVVFACFYRFWSSFGTFLIARADPATVKIDAVRDKTSLATSGLKCPKNTSTGTVIAMVK